MEVNRGQIIFKRRWKPSAIIILTLFCTACTTQDVQLARDLVPGTADIQIYDIRQFRMGISPDDAITILVDTLEGEYSLDLEEGVVSCVRSGFDQVNLSSVQILSPGEFRRFAFPNATAEHVLSQPWEQRLAEPVLRERIASLGLRYLIAVTVSSGKTLTKPARTYWEWQRFSIMSAKVVDLRQARVTGKVSASVQKHSAAGLPLVLVPLPPSGPLVPTPAPVPFVIPSFVEEQSCNEFGVALATFLKSEEAPPKIIMSNLTVDNLFPQRLSKNEMIVLENVAPTPKTLTALLLGSDETALDAERTGISVSETLKWKKVHAGTGISRWEEVQPWIKARKKLIVYEDPNARWHTKGAGFQNEFCYEIDLSINALTLNTEALPPLPSPWHLVPVWIAKAVSLPIQLAIPIVPILTAPLNPQAAIWGLETLYNCLPRREDERKTGDDNSTSANGNPIVNSATAVNLKSFVHTESFFKPQAHKNADILTAAETGDTGKVRLLIQENKQLINARNQAALTALHLAAVNGRAAVAKVLLANNADVNSVDWQGATPLKLAIRNGYTDIVDLLREHGAKD